MIDLFKSGGPVMYPLLACSIIVLTVIIERALFWALLHTHREQELLDEVLATCQQGDWQKIKNKAGKSNDYIIRLLITGIVHRQFSMAKAMEAAATEQLQRMRRFLGVLDTMITVAPLLGIFGTVIGIIISFDMLGATGIEAPQDVTRGIAQALITTATGLGIAILSIFPYNYFNSRVEKAAHLMEQYATSLEIVYEKLTQKD